MRREWDTYGEERPKKKSGNGKALFVLLILVAACAFLAILYLKTYSPDPDANKNPLFPGMEGAYGDALPGLPEYGGDAFSGMKQERGRYNFLIVGLDRASNSTDIMMVVSYNVVDGKINIVQIPRDTYIKTDDIKSVGRINAYYAVYYNSAKKNGADSPELLAVSNLAALIERNFRVRINYSAVVDLDGFVKIIDAVGGVDLTIPEDMFYEDPYQDLYIDLKAGYQHLDGEHAMQFVRYRKGYVQQDLGRQNALKNFMSALMSQMKERMSIKMLAEITGTVTENLTSNIGASDFLYFGRSALSVDLSQVHMMTLPGESASVGGASVYVLYRDDTIAMINEYLNVFGVPVDKESFDPDGCMYRADSEASRKIYESPLGTAGNKIYDASDVSDDPIDIPRK